MTLVAGPLEGKRLLAVGEEISPLMDTRSAIRERRFYETPKEELAVERRIP